MIWLSPDDRELLQTFRNEISLDNLKKIWKQLMEFSPIPSGSLQEEQAIQYLKGKLEEFGLSPVILHYSAYLSIPKEAQLTVMAPKIMNIQCTPYRQVATTPSEGIMGEVIYLNPNEVGNVDCHGKIVLVEQTVSDDWMGLRARRLLDLEQMGVKGLIVIEQDTVVPTIVHQRADFSVSGNPTSDNFHLIPQIPAIVHVSNNDGQILKTMCKDNDLRVKLKSVVETDWYTIPLLVADIEGSKNPTKFILVNGHVDTPPFSPGVTDNASGNVAMLELARIFMKYKKRMTRSIRFAFWTGHEIGRYAGSTWYNDAYWHDLRYNCIGVLNIDSPGAEGAITYRPVPMSEIKELATNSIHEVTGINVQETRWPSRAGDSSFWGTGLTHGSLISARPQETYDKFVNYSGGGWWWHCPWATLDRGDAKILSKDIEVNLHYILKMCNGPVLPINFIDLADELLKHLEELQRKSDKIRAYYNLNLVIAPAKEFKKLTVTLEDFIKRVMALYEMNEDKSKFNSIIVKLNYCLMWISRFINPITHSNAGITEQMSMETFGALPFPRLQQILDLAKIPLPHASEFKLLVTKLIRQRNLVEDGFFLANELIRDTLRHVESSLPTV